MSNEVIIRIGFFLGIFVLMAVWELLRPRRDLTISKSSRWFSNLTIVLIDNVAVRLLFPVLPIGIALIAEKNGSGLLNSLDLPYFLKVVSGVIALDFIIYLQHVMFHSVPAFWRLHKVHHTDLDFDVTTGIRFHPIEIILSMFVKLAAVYVIGAPALSVIIFEILLNGTSMFNHSNIFLHLGIDRVLRFIVVTPDMHRIHHSVNLDESNSNFGFNLPWWDRLLGTYRVQPEAGHKDMTIGISEYRGHKRLALPWLLALPFVGKKEDSTQNQND